MKDSLQELKCSLIRAIGLDPSTTQDVVIRLPLLGPITAEVHHIIKDGKVLNHKDVNYVVSVAPRDLP